ncbi:MAG: aminotransferase class I/II-fold pyridoxal phosphate-dependent enzyme [Myxococcales bacterium]|nr:aminotransferase class I/II-fold pyridoxal phosphate-dependent enzyme [Myxococcales bacterium]
MRIGSRLAKLAISDIRAMTIACQAKGGINLGQGVCDLPTPEPVARGAIRAIEGHIATYAHPMGIAELRQAVARKVETLYGVSYDPQSEVVITSGATGGFAASILALCEPGDEIILFEPYYGYHLNTVLSLGLVPVLVPLVPPTWQIDRQALERAVTSKTRAIVICTPSNPGGKVLSESERELLADFCQSHNLIAFCDEIYEHIVFDGKRHLPLQQLPQMRSRCVTLTGLSKTFSITGWRIGYLTTTAEAASRIAIAHDLLYVCAPTPLQLGSLTGMLETPRAYYDELSAMYQRKRDILCSALTDAGLHPYWPAGAYYVLADVRKLGCATSRQAAMKLLDEVGIAAISGTSFYQDPVGETMLRFCFAKSDDALVEAACRLRRLC